MNNMEFVWLGIIIVAIIVEASSVSLTSIWFAIGALFAWLLSLVFPNNPGLEIFCFLVVSITLLIFTRPIAMKYLKVGREKTNVNLLVGKLAIVIVDIQPLDNKGQVKVDGQIWSAKTPDNSEIKKDTKVRIKSIQGVKLIVTKDN